MIADDKEIDDLLSINIQRWEQSKLEFIGTLHPIYLLNGKYL
jgi:hypothetical protein